MKVTQTQKEGVAEIADEMGLLLEQAISLKGLSSGPLREWERIVAVLGAQVQEEFLRVAVVGAIKSGKSTCVNALLGRDYLKRGAGVVTSIITRVRRSQRLEAVLDMKSWEEINDDINKALVLFPAFDDRIGDRRFDIRNGHDRRELEQSIASLEREAMLGQESLDAKIALLMAYVKGFDSVRDDLESGAPVKLFTGPEAFPRHQDFAGDDSRAVYLKNLLLRVPDAGILDDHTEIGDCQGVDSINPRHLAMIQEYLLQTSLIVYVVSSRTGLRRADVSFLTLIRQMGFSDTFLFVLNADLHEHSGLQDLMNNVGRVREELSLVIDDPQLFVFSALYSLFQRLDGSIPERDRLRLEQWRSDQEMATFSDEQYDTFCSVLESRLNRDRSASLVTSYLERLASAASGLRDWAFVNERIIAGSSEEARQTMESIREIQGKLEEQKRAVQDALDGRAEKIKKVIGKDVEGFLNGRYGDLSEDIRGFVERYSVDLRERVKDMPEGGFSPLLYSLFQEFRESFERFIVEKINPRLVAFIRQEEQKVEELFRGVAELYEALVNETSSRHRAVLAGLGVDEGGAGPAAPSMMSGKGTKKTARPTMPSFLSTLQFGAEIRAGAILKLGLYRGIRLLRAVLKRPAKSASDHQDTVSALEHALHRIKRETATSLTSAINDYKETMKFQHLYRFTDTMARDLYDAILDRYRVYSIDMSDLAEYLEKNQAEKDRTLQVLNALKLESDGILARIHSFESVFCKAGADFSQNEASDGRSFRE